MCFFFFKQNAAYEVRISDWSSDVCSSDLVLRHTTATSAGDAILAEQLFDVGHCVRLRRCVDANRLTGRAAERDHLTVDAAAAADGVGTTSAVGGHLLAADGTDLRHTSRDRTGGGNGTQDPTDIRNCGSGLIRGCRSGVRVRSEEHTSELQSLMRISYAVFCLKKK